jgi:hypothetical protein
MAGILLAALTANAVTWAIHGILNQPSVYMAETMAGALSVVNTIGSLLLKLVPASCSISYY